MGIQTKRKESIIQYLTQQAGKKQVKSVQSLSTPVREKWRQYKLIQSNRSHKNSRKGIVNAKHKIR